MSWKTLAIALSLLTPLAARADSLTLVYNGASDACAANITMRHCVVIPNAHVQRLLAAYLTNLNLAPGSTNAQVFQTFAQGVFNMMRTVVLVTERDAAAKAAGDAAQPITVSPQ